MRAQLPSTIAPLSKDTTALAEAGIATRVETRCGHKEVGHKLIHESRMELNNRPSTAAVCLVLIQDFVDARAVGLGKLIQIPIRIGLNIRVCGRQGGEVNRELVRLQRRAIRVTLLLLDSFCVLPVANKAGNTLKESFGDGFSVDGGAQQLALQPVGKERHFD